MSVIQMESYGSWEDLSRELGGVSKRWLASRVADGMPSYLIANHRRFKVREAVRWLEANGYVEGNR